MLLDVRYNEVSKLDAIGVHCIGTCLFVSRSDAKSKEDHSLSRLLLLLLLLKLSLWLDPYSRCLSQHWHAAHIELTFLLLESSACLRLANSELDRVKRVFYDVSHDGTRLHTVKRKQCVWFKAKLSVIGKKNKILWRIWRFRDSY